MDALKPYLTGNARFLGYGDSNWYGALAKFVAANPYGAKILSLDRDVTKQRQLWEDALRKYGSEKAARRWVAPPGASMHNRGGAADLKYDSPEARKWAHDNAAAHGLVFPMGHEPWHVEPVGARKVMPAGANESGGAPSAVPYVGPDGKSFAVPGAGVAPMPPTPTPPPVASPLGTALSEGFAGLAKSFAPQAAAAPALPQKSGPVALNGPQSAQLAPQLQGLADPMLTPQSKTLAELLKALGGTAL